MPLHGLPQPLPEWLDLLLDGAVVRHGLAPGLEPTGDVLDKFGLRLGKPVEEDHGAELNPDVVPLVSGGGTAPVAIFRRSLTGKRRVCLFETDQFLMRDDEVGFSNNMLVVACRIVDHGELVRRSLQRGDRKLALPLECLAEANRLDALYTAVTGNGADAALIGEVLA